MLDALQTARQIWPAHNAAVMVDALGRMLYEAGMQRLGALLYGVIRGGGYLPELELPAWPEASRELREIHAAGLTELAVEPSTQALRTLDEVLDVAGIRRSEAIHIHGGLHPGGLVGPYAALAMRNVPGGRLRLLGRCLPRTELDGTRVEVRANDVTVGTIELRAERELDESWTLPDELSGEEFLTVVLAADDFVYAGPHLRRCVTLQLDRLEVRP